MLTTTASDVMYYMEIGVGRDAGKTRSFHPHLHVHYPLGDNFHLRHGFTLGTTPALFDVLAIHMFHRIRALISRARRRRCLSQEQHALCHSLLSLPFPMCRGRAY